MFVSTKKYNDLSTQLDMVIKDKDRLARENESLSERNIALNAEVKRLAALISASNKECNVGPWCNDCKHMRSDRVVTAGEEQEFCGRYYRTGVIVDGDVMYCAKHLHDLCPEHSKHSEEES